MIDFWLADLRWLLLAPPLLNPEYVDFVGKIVAHSDDERVQIENWLQSLYEPEQQMKCLDGEQAC
jgi:hypothetical protein